MYFFRLSISVFCGAVTHSVFSSFGEGEAASAVLANGFQLFQRRNMDLGSGGAVCFSFRAPAWASFIFLKSRR